MPYASPPTNFRAREIVGLLVLALAVLLFLTLVTDGYDGSLRRPMNGEAPNAFGRAGDLLATFLTLMVGASAHVLYIILGIWGAMMLCHRPFDRPFGRVAGLMLLSFSAAVLLELSMPGGRDGAPLGGIVGDFLAGLLTPRIGVVGSYVVVVTSILIAILLATEFLFFQTVATVQALGFFTFRRVYRLCLAIPSTEEPPRGRPLLPARLIKKDAETTAKAPRNTDIPAMEEDSGPARPSINIKVWDEPEVANLRQLVSREERAALMPAQLDLSEATPSEEAPFDEVPELDQLAEDILDGVDTLELAEESGEAPFEFVMPAEEDEAPFEIASDADEAPPTPLGEPGDIAESLAADLEDEFEEEAQEEEEEEADNIVALPSLAAVRAEGNGTNGRPARPPMPRRKTMYDDELPEDYVYPKRYTLPPLNLFEAATRTVSPDMTRLLEKISKRLEETLRTFNIEAKVTDVVRGPTITRFELEPAPGIKVSRFQSLADDLALALKAHRVRVEAPIPGKGRVGIEVPNAKREQVVVRDLLESNRFDSHDGALPLALGKDIAGDVLVADLAAMPHCLVAGATGSGKTVCVKTLLASLLCTRRPDEMQLMLIDPKMVELSIFNEIPHLITPVVIDPKKASAALQWLIAEMEERYKLFAHLRVRNIEVYNESVDNGEIEMPHEDGAAAESMNVIRKLPYIVCVIDELADLMMLARAEVEDAIARLAQLARAVGIHLIVATQRPSVDVLTGVIKANFPARISFQVSSRVDSRCILDEIGAERLIGKGDMLYLPAGQSKPTRVQGAFVSDEEMHRLIGYLKTQAPAQYRDEIERYGQQKETQEDFLDADDELFDEAVRVVLETGQASISMVQRRLRVGYTRAARLIDMMELRGIVGPHVGSKAREILVTVPPSTEDDL